MNYIQTLPIDRQGDLVKFVEEQLGVNVIAAVLEVQNLIDAAQGEHSNLSLSAAAVSFWQQVRNDLILAAQDYFLDQTATNPHEWKDYFKANDRQGDLVKFVEEQLGVNVIAAVLEIQNLIDEAQGEHSNLSLSAAAVSLWQQVRNDLILSSN